MRIKASTPLRTGGNVLIVALIITAVLGATLASYLWVVRTQSRSVVRSQYWNQVLVVAEAGLEEALQTLNQGAGTANVGNWTGAWPSPTANVYRRERNMSPSTSYVVYITNNAQDMPVVRSTGYVVLPGPVATNTTLARSVEVQVKTSAMFNVAMAALGSIDLKGNGIASDSFDSSTNLYSTNQKYDPLKRKAGGDIVTNNTITNSTFTIANANIAGHVTTGPSGNYSIGPNGTVGDLAWVASSLGIKPGWAANDLNVTFSSVVMPGGPWSITGPGGAGTGGSGTVVVNGVATVFNHVFTAPIVNNGYYTVSDNGSIYVGTNLNVTIKATTASFSPRRIYVAGTGATAGKMAAYLTGTSATLGTEHMTQSGVAVNMAFFGMPSVIDLGYKGNGDFTGVMYMPSADFHLAGGGSGTIDFIGASVTKTIQMNGHYNFHYDESLKKAPFNNGYVVAYWVER